MLNGRTRNIYKREEKIMFFVYKNKPSQESKLKKITKVLKGDSLNKKGDSAKKRKNTIAINRNSLLNLFLCRTVI
jgi:hypothetical protein